MGLTWMVVIGHWSSGAIPVMAHRGGPISQAGSMRFPRHREIDTIDRGRGTQELDGDD